MTTSICPAHPALDNNLTIIATAVKRLEESQQNTAAVQVEMSQSLAVMASTLSKIEDTNVVIERLSGRLETVVTLFEKFEKEHHDLAERLRAVEEVSCHPRLKKLEAAQEKCPQVVALAKQVNKIEGGKAWLTRLVIGALVLGTIGLGFHAIRHPIGYTKYTVQPTAQPPAIKEKW